MSIPSVEGLIMGHLLRRRNEELRHFVYPGLPRGVYRGDEGVEASAGLSIVMIIAFVTHGSSYEIR